MGEKNAKRKEALLEVGKKEQEECRKEERKGEGLSDDKDKEERN